MITETATPVVIIWKMTDSSANTQSIPIWLILVIATAAGLGAYLGQLYWSPRDAATDGFAPISASGQFLRYPQPKQINPVVLQGGDGNAFPVEQLKGRWSLVFFGFTHCPDACPTALATLKAVSDKWAELPLERQPQVLFVSVDPERDSPEVLQRYVHFFNPDFLTATADHSVMLPWTRSLGVVYEQVAGTEGSDYSVDHSTSILVFDPELNMVGMLRPPHTPAQILEDLQPILQLTP